MLLYREGAKNVVAGANPMELKRGIEVAVEAVVAAVKKASIETKTNETIAQVGTISANGDAEIGNTIATELRQLISYDNARVYRVTGSHDDAEDVLGLRVGDRVVQGRTKVEQDEGRTED